MIAASSSSFAVKRDGRGGRDGGRPLLLNSSSSKESGFSC